VNESDATATSTSTTTSTPTTPGAATGPATVPAATPTPATPADTGAGATSADSRPTDNTVRKVSMQSLPEELEKKFMEVRKALVDKYKSRMNPASVDRHLAQLMMNEKITETYQLADHPQAPVITFRDLRTDMIDLITRLSMSNLQELRNATPGTIVTPRFDETYRTDMLMSAATIQLRDKEFPDVNLDLAQAYRDGKVNEIVATLEARVLEIKSSLHPVLYQEAQAAFSVWINYLAELLKPGTVENF